MSRPSWRRLGMAAGLVASALVVGFHALLLWERIRDLSIFEPLVALEWIAGLAMLMVLRHLRQHRVSLLRGRKALAFWLLVLLLHLIAAPPVADSVAEPGGLLMALPASWVLLFWIAAIAALWALGRRTEGGPLAAQRRRGSPAERVSARPGHPVQLLPRPPPLHASI